MPQVSSGHTMLVWLGAPMLNVTDYAVHARQTLGVDDVVQTAGTARIERQRIRLCRQTRRNSTLPCHQLQQNAPVATPMALALLSRPVSLSPARYHCPMCGPRWSGPPLSSAAAVPTVA